MNVGLDGEGLNITSGQEMQVTIPANQTHQDFTVDTATGKVIGAGGKVTATIQASDPAPENGAGYAIDGAKASVQVPVADADSPSDANWSITLADEPLTEGGSTAVTVSLADGYSFSTDRTIKIRWNELDLAAPLDLQGGATDDTLTLADRSSSVSAILAYTDGPRRNLYSTNTVGAATAKLSARVAPPTWPRPT